MSFFSSLFGKSRKPSRIPLNAHMDTCQEVGGKVYPHDLADIPRIIDKLEKGIWQLRPNYFRIDRYCPSWKPFQESTLWQFYNRLELSDWEKEKLTEAGFTDADSISKSEADRRLNQIKKDKEISAAQKRAEKDALAPTKHWLKKMEECGIEYQEGMTRGECKSLVARFELEKAEAEQKEKELIRISELRFELEKLGIKPPAKASIQEIESFLMDSPDGKHRERFDGFYSKYRELGGKKKLNPLMTASEMDDMTTTLEDAFDYADCLVEEVEVGAVDGDNFTLYLKGHSGEENYDEFKLAVVEKYLKIEDAFNPTPFVKKFFPHLEIERENF